jgi:transposase
MIPVPTGVRVWMATGHADMRRGMNGLALQVQRGLKHYPHAGDLFVFRGRRGDLVPADLSCRLHAVSLRPWPDAHLPAPAGLR